MICGAGSCERFPGAKFVSYASLADDGAVEGAQLAFGKPLVPRHQPAPANVILSLDADFLGEGYEQTRLSREFAARREPSRQMSRLYVVEPADDHHGRDGRSPAAPSGRRDRGVPVVADLDARQPRPGGAGAARVARRTRSAGGIRSGWSRSRPTSSAAAATALIIAGRRQPAAVHALVAALNVALNNLGNTVEFGAPLTSDPLSGVAPLAALAQDIAAGGVDTLVITATNPVYGAPVDLKFAKLLERVPNTIYHTLYEDETAAAVKPSSRRRTRWSRGAICGRPTAPCRSCSR